MLNRTQTVMDIDDNTRMMKPNTVPFVSSERAHDFEVDKDVWEDLGSPTTITVTVEPGDTLNG